MEGIRDSEDSRYVSLVLPRYAVRLPYGAKFVPVESFSFEEDVDGKILQICGQTHHINWV